LLNETLLDKQAAVGIEIGMVGTITGVVGATGRGVMGTTTVGEAGTTIAGVGSRVVTFGNYFTNQLSYINGCPCYGGIAKVALGSLFVHQTQTVSSHPEILSTFILIFHGLVKSITILEPV
jgi:hypothetical protein